MNGTKFCALALAVTLTACAASAQRDWDPAKAGESPWRFEGHETPFGKTTININGQPALVGSISIWTGAGELSGTYEKHTVTASCDKPKGSDARTLCEIKVDGERATSLYFRVKEVLGDSRK
jgi:hypothetical protein